MDQVVPHPYCNELLEPVFAKGQEEQFKDQVEADDTISIAHLLNMAIGQLYAKQLCLLCVQLRVNVASASIGVHLLVLYLGQAVLL